MRRNAVTLPKDLKESKLNISADENGVLTIDRESRKLHKSEDGSYQCYTCTATMPDSVCDSLITLRLPPVTVLYDGIALQAVAIEAKGTYKPLHCRALRRSAARNQRHRHSHIPASSLRAKQLTTPTTATPSNASPILCPFPPISSPTTSTG